MRGSFGRAILAAAVVIGALAAAPTAQAALFAAPGGPASGTCETPDPPCDLEYAVEVASGPGDEVVVNSGNYTLGATSQLTVPANVDVHGPPGGTRPAITSNYTSTANAVTTGADSRIADLAIFYTQTATALSVSNDTVAERLYVFSAGTNACSPIGATLRDSVCWSTAANGNGVFNATNSAGTATTTLRNVTAIADGATSDGIHFETSLTLNHTVDAKNVIAAGTQSDVHATTVSAGATTTINLSNSNYANADASGSGTESVTPPGTGTNQMAAPGFVNAPTGDFHQSPNSVTVNAGAADSQLGSQDLDGEARNQGAAPDIGADELPAPATGPNGDTFPPDTGIRDGPKKKYPKRKVTFEFGGSEPGVTFECRLDVGSRQGSFEPCTSPHEIRGMKRKTKYVFAVRAVDAAGNADPTPADRRWKVIKKKKKK